MYRENEQPQRFSGFGSEDPSEFGDLIWEREMLQERQHSENRHSKKPVNLTARIEDYIRSYL